MVDLPRKGVLRERPFTHEGNYLVSSFALASQSSFVPYKKRKTNKQVDHETYLSPKYKNRGNLQFVPKGRPRDNDQASPTVSL